MSNGIDLLVEQHARIRTLMDLVQSTSGDARRDRFDELRTLLAVHEAAEELVLRPLTRRLVKAEVADQRIGEENAAKELLATLEKEGPSSASFDQRFGELKLAVVQHADCEETQEFPALREKLTTEQLTTLAEAVKAAETAAPTHPHPSARSTAAVASMGPAAAVVDRVRDAVGSMVERLG